MTVKRLGLGGEAVWSSLRRVCVTSLALALLMSLGEASFATTAAAAKHKKVTAKSSSAKRAVTSSHAGTTAKSKQQLAAVVRGTRGRRVPTQRVTLRTMIVMRHGRRVKVRVPIRARWVEHFTANSFAENTTQGDVTAGEDPVVRAAAIEALGNMNGTALAIDPSSGRILAMVNQRLALSSGAEPCSTIKLTVALSALEEGLIRHDTPVSLGGSYKVDLDYALARSINPYFEQLGRMMGFERVKHYANEFGLGELAGYHIAGEQLGTYPDEELPARSGGVGRMCSFGEGISMTPLQLGAIVSAIANGGTLYYLQHPETQDEVRAFVPHVKRILNIAPILPEMHPGMLGAVEASYGTARSLRANFSAFPVLGKTGTCSNNGTRFGWFGSYADTPTGRIVTVIFLEGGRPTFGPKAAELTGQFYRGMYERSYFQPRGVPLKPLAPEQPAPVNTGEDDNTDGGGAQ